MRERESFNVRRRRARFAGVLDEKGERRSRERRREQKRDGVANQGKRAEVGERKAESEESASDDEEGVASIGEGSSVGRNTAREG